MIEELLAAYPAKYQFLVHKYYNDKDYQSLYHLAASEMQKDKRKGLPENVGLNQLIGLLVTHIEDTIGDLEIEEGYDYIY